MIAPEPKDAPMQLVDARDQGEWIVRLAEQRRQQVLSVLGEELGSHDPGGAG